MSKITKKIIESLMYYRNKIEHNDPLSQGELAELQSLSKYIDEGDVQLLEWAGVEEDAPRCPECSNYMSYDMDSEWHCGNEECKVNQVHVKVTPMYTTPTPDWHN